MTRGITQAFDDALSEPVVRWLMFVEMDFAGGFVRATNATHNIVWNSVTWIGLGELGSVDVVEESVQLGARGMKLTLSGVDPSLVATALAEHYQNRAVRIYCVPLDEQHRMILTPMQLWAGHMDTMTIAIGSSATITVTAENQLAGLLVPRERHYNDADQQAEFPGDLGMIFVDDLMNQKFTWGGVAPPTGPTYYNPFANLDTRANNSTSSR